MYAGLYDVLRGRFHDEATLAATPVRDHRLQSVISNLTRLFNTRQGTVAHLPTYGLPDVSTVYRDAPHSIDTLRQAVKDVIQTYEPRLRRVYVEHQDTHGGTLRLVFLISADLEEGRRITFQTTFESDELVAVSPWTRAG